MCGTALWPLLHYVSLGRALFSLHGHSVVACYSGSQADRGADSFYSCAFAGGFDSRGLESSEDLGGDSQALRSIYGRVSRKRLRSAEARFAACPCSRAGISLTRSVR
jgi:hypothetical protein